MLKLAECSRQVYSSLMKLAGSWKGSVCWCLIDCTQGNVQFRGLCLTIIPFREISGLTFLLEALTQENLDVGDLADL
jgi:hypothetical protein